MTRKRLLILFVVSAAFMMVNNNTLSLWDEDEAAYAGFAYRMIETGNWMIPEFQWSEVHRKTPLHFWAIAASYKLFGINEFAVRFPSVLALLFTAFFIYLLGKQLYTERIAMGAAAITLANIMLLSLAKVSVTDSLLLLCETVAILSLLLVLKGKNRLYSILLWLAVAAGIMVKGPPILILVLGTGGLLVLFHPQRKNLIHTHPWFFIPLALAPFYYWALETMKHDQGAFLNWLFDWYVVQRFTGEVFGQTGPPGYFFVVFMLMLLPFSALMFRSMRRLFNELPRWFNQLGWALFLFAFAAWFVNLFTDFKYLSWAGLALGIGWLMAWVYYQDRPLHKEFAAWIACGWGIYELMHSKLPTYALGAFPAIALLTAHVISNLTRITHRDMRNTRKVVTGLIVLVALALIVSSIMLGNHWILKTSGIVAGIMVMSSAWLYLFGNFSRQNIYRFFPYLALFIGFTAWYIVIPSFELKRSAGKRLAQFADTELVQQPFIYISRNYHQPSLMFYLVDDGFTPITMEHFPEKVKKKKLTIPLIVDSQDYKRLEEAYPTFLAAHNKVRFEGMASDKGAALNLYLIY